MTTGPAFFRSAGVDDPDGPLYWDSAYTDPSLTLSNGDKTVTRTGNGVNETQGTSGRRSAKRYFEVAVGVTRTDLPFAPAVGVILDQADDYSVGYVYCSDGQFIHSGSPFATTGTAGGSGTVAVAVDFATGKVWFAKDNAWQNSGDPAAGIGEQVNLGAGTRLWPVFIANFGAASGTIAGASADFTYAPPTGFDSWAGT